MNRGRPGKQIAIVTLAIAILAGAAGARVAQDAAAESKPIDPELLEVIEMLEDPSYANREAASRRLLETTIERSTLLQLVRRPELSCEQQHRLLWIFRQQLLQTPRGAVGIRMSQDAVGDVGPVRIAELLPGLPAERVLEIGDRITHIDGRPLASSRQLIMDVQTKAPGDIVHLTVERTVYDETGREMRDEERNLVTETVEVDLELGNADLLIDERTGRPQRGGPLDEQRVRDVTGIVRRFGPAPKVLSVRGTTELDMLDEPDDLDVLAERHIAIRTILAERRAVEDGRLTLSPELRERWRLQLNELRVTLRQPDLSDVEREDMRRVVERYRGLIEG